MEGEAQTTAESTGDPLRPVVCPRCEYALAGLPATGVCPECGRAYGATEVVLYGYMAGRQFRQRKELSRQGLVWAWAVGAIGVGIDLASNFRRAPFGIRFIPWHMLGPAMCLVIFTRQAVANRGSGLLQVRLGPDGVRQGTRGLGVIPYEKADAVPPTPWSDVRRVTTDVLPDGWLKITATAAEPGVRITQQPVNATVRCSRDALPPLRDRIAGWRAAADRR